MACSKRQFSSKSLHFGSIRCFRSALRDVPVKIELLLLSPWLCRGYVGGGIKRRVPRNAIFHTLIIPVIGFVGRACQVVGV